MPVVSLNSLFLKMRTIVPALVIFLWGISYTSFAQPFQKAAADAYLINRMAQKYHVQPRPLDKALSGDLFNNLLKEIDEGHLLLTKEDMLKLEPYRWLLADQVQQKKTDFLQLLTDLYKQHLLQVDTMADHLCSNVFNFALPGNITLAEDTSYPADNNALRSKLSKRLRLMVLQALLETHKEIVGSVPAPRQKKILDSLEIVYRKKAVAFFKRPIHRILQHPGGIEQSMADSYCRQLALCYDPHTAYFPPLEKENFESELGKQPLRFGFSLGEDDDENVTIGQLKPGSPAYKSGQLNKGDKIQTIQWEKQGAINVDKAGKREVESILDASNHDKVTLTIKKTDGTIRQVTLKKEKDETNEDNKVTSFILKGTKTIGYISLPAFYTDWEDKASGANGCANDVAKELVKLKAEKIDGLILDLRFNGGGSIDETTELAGIFIDAGPVAQEKSTEPKVFTLKDVNRGTVYDGPLLILVNGHSASASEMLAGTLQDYNRAIIAGTPTYGKATSQVILPLDTTLKSGANNTGSQSAAFIKLTVSKLYRVNGSSAQSAGVQPDILLPDVLEADAERESSEPLALKAPAIDANKYFKPYAPLKLSALKAVAEKEIAADPYFKAVDNYVQQYKKASIPKDISLQWDEALRQQDMYPDIDAVTGDSIPPKAFFTVQNNVFETKRAEADESYKEIIDELKEFILEDHYIRMAYILLSNAGPS